MKNATKLLLATAVTTDLLILDQLTKYFAKTMLDKPVVLIDNFLKLKYAQNTGIAFSLPVPYELIIVSNILLIALLIYLAAKELDFTKTFTIIAMSCLVAGGIGNLIDRLIFGYVIDYISIWKYPFFNLADTYIVAAVLLLIIFYGKIKQVKK